MLKAHAGDAERVDRIGRPSVFLREPLLTVAVSPQPDLLRGLVAQPGFRGRGLLGRFLYFLPRSPLGRRTLESQPVPEATRDAYESGLRAMLDWPEEFDDKGQSRPHILKLSADANEEWLAFARHIERLMLPGAEFEYATDWAGKAPGAAVRVAGVLHAADHAHGRPWMVDIPRETMQRALDIVGTSSAHTLAAYRWMAADQGMAAAQQLWAWVQRKRRLSFKARDAWQGLKGTNAFSRMADVTAALECLAERGYLVLVGDVTGKPGRAASPFVVVRPELAEGWS